MVQIFQMLSNPHPFLLDNCQLSAGIRDKLTCFAGSRLMGETYCVFTSHATPLSVGLSFFRMPEDSFFTFTSSSNKSKASSGSKGTEASIFLQQSNFLLRNMILHTILRCGQLTFSNRILTMWLLVYQDIQTEYDNASQNRYNVTIINKHKRTTIIKGAVG